MYYEKSYGNLTLFEYIPEQKLRNNFHKLQLSQIEDFYD